MYTKGKMKRFRLIYIYVCGLEKISTMYSCRLSFQYRFLKSFSIRVEKKKISLSQSWIASAYAALAARD